MNVVVRASALFAPRSVNRSVGPIGIDFGLESVHLVQLEAASGLPAAVRARASLEYGCTRRELLGSPVKFRSLIKRALAADRFSGRKAVIAIPPDMFRTVSINYHSAEGADKEAAAILKVMQNRLDGDLADFVLDYLPVKSRSKNDERLALVAVSERRPIVDFLEHARKARLNVQALEIGPVAICRLVGVVSQDSGSGNVLVINSGRQVSYLTVISGSDLLFDQEVDFGENSLIAQTAETLDISADMARNLIMQTGVACAAGTDTSPIAMEEAGLVDTLTEILKPHFLKLVDEIKRVCLYAAAETRGGAVSQIYLLGGIARWPGSDELLSNLTGSRVEKIQDPLAPFRAGAERDDSAAASDFVVATGAALRGLQDHG
jgi:Tfp pilus assembly PilM family ATPase